LHLCRLFKLAKSSSARKSFFQARGGICCAATPASDPVVSGWSVSRFGHGRRPRSNASRLSPISHLRAAGRHRRASRLHNRTEGVVARHTVSQPEKLVRGSRARPWGKDRHIYCCPAETWLPSGPAQDGGGKTDGFEVWFAELKELPEIKNIIQYPSGAYPTNINKIELTISLVSSPLTDVIEYSGTQLLGPDRGPVAIGAACATAYLHAAQRKAQ
jgi:hypothetical protein